MITTNWYDSRPVEYQVQRYVIVSRDTDISVFEFANPDLIARVNTDKYYVMTVYDYLCRANAEIQAGSTKYNSK